MQSPQLLKGQDAIITGGTSGIGKAIAETFLQQGARVAIVGSNKEKGELAAKELAQNCHEGQIYFYQIDVSNKESVDQGIKDILAKFGKVDILVNNAGITRDQLLMKMTEEDWDIIMDVNAKSCFFLSQALIRPMLKARQGRIINMSSIVGISGNAGQANYAASKAAIIGFTRALAKEVASRNILVNCIAPGFIQTPMTHELNDLQKETILAKIPLGRMGEASDIAQMALFLASPMAKYITGQVFVVDGGMTIT
ncbi:MAG: 3-oxoacyl-ACP reductase FabG [Parachlamydiales bacterium]|jgi:3-oxoacyl-[acyl-carrier protein] reductase